MIQAATEYFSTLGKLNSLFLSEAFDSEFRSSMLPETIDMTGADSGVRNSLSISIPEAVISISSDSKYPSGT